MLDLDVGNLLSSVIDSAVVLNHLELERHRLLLSILTVILLVPSQCLLGVIEKSTAEDTTVTRIVYNVTRSVTFYVPHALGISDFRALLVKRHCVQT